MSDGITMFTKNLLKFALVAAPLSASSVVSFSPSLYAQTAPAVLRQSGTVKSVNAGLIVIDAGNGATYTVQPTAAARVLQLPPGSKDLKTAQPTSVDAIVAGDRLLAVGKAATEANTIDASLVVVMKATDIAQRNEEAAADWLKHGSGGIVTAVDLGNAVITVRSGAHTVAVHTSASTTFRRYASGSVKYEETVPSTLQQIAVGDQLQMRGEKSPDGTSLQAEEVVAGTFANISGLLTAVDASAGTVSLKDLATKKTVTVKIAAATDMRSLPPEMAARLAMRLKASKSGEPAKAGAAPEHTASEAPAGHPPAPEDGQGQHAAPGGQNRAGGDLAQMLPHLPTTTVSALKVGEAVMIVASKGAPSDPLAAVTLLSGVEPILTAAPAGSAGMTLAPWNLGGGAEAGGVQ